MNMIVAYDIANDKRLSRIAKVMLDYGVRVQKSIFEVNVTPPVFRKLQERIEKIIVAEFIGVLLKTVKRFATAINSHKLQMVRLHNQPPKGGDLKNDRFYDKGR